MDSRYKKVVHKYIPLPQCTHILSTDLFTLSLSCYFEIVGHKICLGSANSTLKMVRPLINGSANNQHEHCFGCAHRR